MDKFKNKFRVDSTRLKHWDYALAGGYFITICTKDRKCYLGQIINDQMNLSSMGKIVERFWLRIPKHFSFVTLDEYVIMPNHIHGIIVINDIHGRDKAWFDFRSPQVALSLRQ